MLGVVTSSSLRPGLPQLWHQTSHGPGKRSILAQLGLLVLLLGGGYGCKRRGQKSRPGLEGDKHTQELRLGPLGGGGATGSDFASERSGGCTQRHGQGKAGVSQEASGDRGQALKTFKLGCMGEGRHGEGKIRNSGPNRCWGRQGPCPGSWPGPRCPGVGRWDPFPQGS